MSDKLVYIDSKAYWRTPEGLFIEAETKDGRLVETAFVMRGTNK